MENKILLFFTIFGMFSFTFILFTAIHELGHYINMKNNGAELREFVILGIRTGDSDTSGAFAWVSPDRNYNHTFDSKWDCVWSLGTDCNGYSD